MSANMVIIAFLILKCLPCILCGCSGAMNLTNFQLHRQRRFLIYENGGVIKFVVGPTLLVPLGDPILFRSVVVGYNLQGGQYPLPDVPLYPWDKWESTFSRAFGWGMSSAEIHPRSDNTRLFVYTALEQFMERQNVNLPGGSGRVCLLRSICENAQVAEHVGLLAEILNIILTPGKEPLDPVYMEAHAAGAAGVNCLHLFPDCPRGVNFLDEYLDFL